MGITVNKPTKGVEIVTDMEALQESINAANELNAARDTGKVDKTIQTKKTTLKKLVAKVDESTIVMRLHGLNASAWNMIVIAHQSVEGDRIVKDWPRMVAEAIPQMLESAVWKTSGDAIEFADGDLAELLDSLTDVQTMDLIVAVQELNTPTATVPKAVRDLI
jgi:hypothetical protein